MTAAANDEAHAPLPPHNLEAEQKVVGSVLYRSERIDEIADMPTEALYWESHQEIVRVARQLHKDGRLVDQVTVAEGLRASDRFVRAGGFPYLTQLVDGVAVLSKRQLAEYVKIVNDAAAARHAISACERAAIRIQAGDDASQVIVSTTAELQALQPAPPDLGFTFAAEIAKPLPPIQWLSRDLTIAPGRSTVLAGEGGTRKSWLAMAMMVCGAGNIRLLGRFRLKDDMRSRYFDYEQTERVTLERFQLLAKGHEVDLAGLGKQLGYRWRPIPTWAPRTDAGWRKAVDALCRCTEGVDLAVVDSMRSCSRGIEENSVFASAPLDLATEVSQRTGVTIVFIDHAGKPQEAGSTRTRKHAQRGHTSKLDSSQTLLILSAAKGEPTLVTCERSQIAAESDWPKDFRFTIAGASGGLQLQEVATPEKVRGDGARFADLKQRIVRLVTEDRTLKSGNAIAARVTGAKATTLQALRELLEAGDVVQPGGEGSPFHVRA